jgi:hypothetical protein
MLPILSKIGIPALFVAAGFSGGMITSKKLEKPVVIPEHKCPACNCEPCNGIDFDKIKGKYITLNNTQKVEMNGDSLIVKRIQEALRQELEDFKVKKCK